MRITIRLAVAWALMACAATGVAAETDRAPAPDDKLTLGEVTIPEYGQDPERMLKTTIYPVSSAGSSADEEVDEDDDDDNWTYQEWSLEAWTIGRTLCEQPSDFRIGETCSLLPTNAIDWAKTAEANRRSDGLAFNLSATNPTERVIFTKPGTVPITWIFAGGTTSNIVDYKIDRLTSARPYRLYATRADEGNVSAYVDLSGKYVKFFGDEKLIGTNVYASTALSNVVYGLDYDARNGLLTYRYMIDKETGRVQCPQGQFVLAYYDTESKNRMISRIVVEVTPPMVNTLSARVGDELRPLGGGYGITGLSPLVNSGTAVDREDPCSPYVETFETEKSTTGGDEKGQLRIYAIAPTDVSTSKLGMDMPWKIDIYWRSPDPMGTLWTFEDDWYLVTWPETAPKVVTSGDAANPGYPLVLPSVYSATVMNYRRPLHMEVSYDSSTHRVTASDEGRFLLRLTTEADSRPRFLPVETIRHTDDRVRSDVIVPWPVGREIVLCPGEDAGCAAAVAGQMDASLPGYIHVPFSKGRNWNPRLYHFSSGNALSEATGSMTSSTNDPFASLTSAIYGVNKASEPIEVWWSGSYTGNGTTDGKLAEPITYPGFVQRFLVRWDLAELDNLYPTIQLFSQKGSADEDMTAAEGLALLFAQSNAVATVSSRPRFRAHERLHLAFSISSLQRSENDHVVTPGRIVTVRNRANRGIVFAVEVTEADSNGYTVVSHGAGSEEGRDLFTHLDWHDYQVEIPPKLADSDLEIIFGCAGKDDDPAALNIAIDGLSCWKGDPADVKSVENIVFLFLFDEDDTYEDKKKGKDAATATVTGGCSLNIHDCGFTFGAPMPYYGVFTAENGVEPEIYYENDETQVGYNPNEEHALMEKTEDDTYIAWALRNDLNFEDTSHAMVLVQYAEDGKGRMAPFRIGAVPGQEEYPVKLDDEGDVLMLPPPGTRRPNGDNAFTNKVVVGSPLLVPKPISLMSGPGTERDRCYPTVWKNEKDTNPLYKDRKNQFWARCEGVVEVKYSYPIAKGMWVPTRDNRPIPDGEYIGWMNNVGKGRPTLSSMTNNPALSWYCQCEWPNEKAVPTMRIGQALTKAVDGLPEMWNAASMAVTYPLDNEGGQGLVELIDPTVARTSSLKIDTGDFPSEFGFTVGATGTCSLRKGKYYFTGCPPSVSDRFYIDANAAETNRMVLVGDYVEKEAGGSYLRLNVLTADERKALKNLCKAFGTAAKERWDKAVENLATEAKTVSVATEQVTNGLWVVSRPASFVIPIGDKYSPPYSVHFGTNISNGYVVCSSEDGTNTVDVVTTNNVAFIGFNRAIWEKPTNYVISVSYNSPEYREYKARYEEHIAKTLCWTNGTVNGKTARCPLLWPKKSGSVCKLRVCRGTFTWWTDDRSVAIKYAAKDHLALIATGKNYKKGWVTLVENDDPDPAHVATGLPVKMHVIRIAPELYSDGIAVVTDPLNKLSEQLTLLYKTPLGDAASDFEFEWRRMKPGADGTLETDKDKWEEYKGDRYGRVSILLGQNGAQPDEYVNTYYTLRYRPKENSDAYNVLWNAGTRDYNQMWSKWAPEQLAEGWLQRVLNSVTPFAQRVEDFYANPSDIGYTMLEQIGKPYTGDVALNNENLTQVGLMELYQTLFNRVETMLVTIGGDRDLSKQLLLAATRLNEFYTLLGAEAYSDAKNPLIGSADGTQFPAGTFSFANQVATLLDEELALLRGRSASTQFPRMTEAPCYNRLVWNFTKGLTEGEPAYVNNYGIRARDGIMDVNCAAAQYPQGHGDAWGHYLSALKIYYRLLRNPAFDWTASMMEMLMDQKIANVDYQDEQKFADAAAKLAQTGLDAFELTLRKDYRERGGMSEEARASGDGYFDANAEQAFGCGEWLTRTEMGAAYNWLVGNAMLPTNAVANQEFTDRGIKKIDRTTALSLGTLCTIVDTLDRKLADYGAGLNPLGLSESAIPFDIDPDELAAKNSHFEQILARAEKSLANCRTVLDYANVYGSRLRQLQENETDALAEREKTELAYNNQLIAIYGTPFPGDIGPGGTYPQGYEGPDIYNYNCMDLSVYGLEELQTDLSKPYSTFTRSTFTVKEKPYSNITYTVTAGGIRMKNPNMTGVRATEGTLQAKYRDYLVAYKAYESACSAYDSAASAAITASSEARSEFTAAFFGMIFKGIVLAGNQWSSDNTAAITSKRWTMVKSELDSVRSALYNQYGLVLGGAAFGNEILKQSKLVIQQHKANVEKLGDSIVQEDDIELDFTKIKEFYFKDQNGNKLTDLTSLIPFDQTGQKVTPKYFFDFTPTGFLEAAQWFQFIYENAFSLGLKGRDINHALDAAIGNVKSAVEGIQAAVANLSTAEAEYRAELYKGDLLQEERARWRQQMSNEATASRYADMFNRVQRNIALSKYSTAFDTAQRYVWELAKVYDYETGLLSSDEKSGKQFLADIVCTRSLGAEGVPIASGTTDGGLYDVVARMKANWDVLKGRLGINNPDKPTKWFSLRHDLREISLDASQDEKWKDWLRGSVVDDIGKLPDFIRYCQPLALSEAGKAKGQGPGIVLTFGTSIYGDKNFFGKNLKPGDTQFSAADYATKIDAVGVYFQGYDEFADASGFFVREPNVYLVPIGYDCMYSPAGTDDRKTLRWTVVDQVLPLPYAIGSTELDNPSWISSFTGANGETTNIRRHSTLRMGYNLTSNRLVGRSAWNTKWMLIIPARSIGSDNDGILRGNDNKNFVEKVKDIKIGIRAYSRQGN